ncbi:MAG: hypothetical protein ACE5FK_01490 [Candidatus Methylomirabilia bacterium]
MPYPPLLFDPEFVPQVASGYGLTLLGGFLLLVAAVWWSVASGGIRLDPKPAVWRLLAFAGWVLFTLGFLWQIIGYVAIGATTWP